MCMGAARSHISERACDSYLVPFLYIMADFMVKHKDNELVAKNLFQSRELSLKSLWLLDSDKHRLIAKTQVNCYRGFISNIGEEINLYHNSAPVTTTTKLMPEWRR